MMTGGVAKNIGVVKALERKMGQKMIVSPKAQIIGAIGAALIGQNA
jgi:activator of 2-hydroxyglutaryl-CoA dehydratase